MGVFRTLFKLSLLIVVVALIAGVVMVIKRSKESSVISFEEWPDVPRKPAA